MVQASKLAPFPPALNLAKALPGLGYRFTFVSLADTRQDVVESIGPGSEHVRIGVGRRRAGLGPVSAMAQGVRFLRGSRRLIQGSHADLFLGCWGGGLLATWLATRKEERRRLVFWANEFIRHDELGRFAPLRYVVLAERLIARRVPLTVVADPVRGKPQTAYLRVGHYIAIRNTPSFQPPQQGPSRLADAVAKIRAAAPGAAVFCFAGSICQGAQISRLLASFALWPANTHLVLVGNVDKDIPDFNLMLQRSGPRVTYLGAMPYGEVERGLPLCDVGVALYNTDWPWSNEIYCAPCKVGDYVKAGLAILVSRNPTLVSLLAEYPIGVAINPLDPGSIAQGASQLMSDRVSGKITSVMVSNVFRTHLNLETQLEPLLRHVGSLG